MSKVTLEVGSHALWCIFSSQEEFAFAVAGVASHKNGVVEWFAMTSWEAESYGAFALVGNATEDVVGCATKGCGPILHVGHLTNNDAAHLGKEAREKQVVSHAVYVIEKLIEVLDKEQALLNIELQRGALYGFNDREVATEYESIDASHVAAWEWVEGYLYIFALKEVECHLDVWSIDAICANVLKHRPMNGILPSFNKGR